MPSNADSTCSSLSAGTVLKANSKFEHYGYFAAKLRIYFPLTISLAKLSMWVNPALYCSEESLLLAFFFSAYMNPAQLMLYNQ